MANANSHSFLRACCAALAQGYKWAAWDHTGQPGEIGSFEALWRTERQRDNHQMWWDHKYEQRFRPMAGLLVQEVCLIISAAQDDETLARELASDLLAMTEEESRGLKKALAWHANQRNA